AVGRRHDRGGRERVCNLRSGVLIGLPPAEEMLVDRDRGRLVLPDDRRDGLIVHQRSNPAAVMTPVAVGLLRDGGTCECENSECGFQSPFPFQSPSPSGGGSIISGCPPAVFPGRPVRRRPMARRYECHRSFSTERTEFFEPIPFTLL